VLTGPQREAQRQQLLLAALWRDVATRATTADATHVATDPATSALTPWLQDTALQARGLAAYRANTCELAQRALAAAYPVVQQLLGEDSFVRLARSLWRQHPPQAGDIALWGLALPAFLESALSLSDAVASDAYLPDIARLEWAVHTAGRAADAAAPQGLALLGDCDPARLLLRLAPGTAVIVSQHPVLSIWHAHQAAAGDRALAELAAPDTFADARAALLAGLAETALVCRRGWRVQVLVLPPAQTRFTQALLSGRTLAQALNAGADDAGAAFAFEDWLIQALQTQLLVGVLPAD
jgi:Putative DNA-binding domain